MRSTLLTLGAAGALVVTSQPAMAEPEPAPTAPIEVPAEYAQQDIRWEPCFPGGAPPELPPGSERLECGTMSAPQDWHDATSGQDITIAVSRLSPNDGPSDRALFTNPGGPGGAGLEMPLALLAQGRAELLQNFDVYGIDVRGTGMSSTVSCGPLEQNPVQDLRDRSPQNIRAQLEYNERFAANCEHFSGELGEHITTEQTVADLDLLRQVESRERISFYGISGGTWLGAYYATYFPNSVDRFVLDSNAQFTGTWQQVFGWQPMAFERRWREDVLPWIARHDELYGLGDTAEEVRNSYEDLRAQLKAEPIPAPTGEVIDHNVLDALAIQTAYSKYAFPAFAESMTALRAPQDGLPQATVDALAQASTRPLPMQQTPPQESQLATMHSLRYNDTPFFGGKAGVVANSGLQSELFPLYGPYTLFQACMSWDRPEVDLRTPNGEGVPPVLMLQSENDPATAAEGARIAHDRFRGSRMVTVTDEGDHGVYAAGNACVDGIVEDYLIDGVVPEGDLTCAGVPLPEPTGAQTTAENPALVSTLQEIEGAIG